MANAQTVLVDSTESIHSYPYTLLRPSSVEVKYITPAKNQFDTFVAGTVENVSQVVNTLAPEGAKSLLMTGTTVVPGNQYLVNNPLTSSLEGGPLVVTIKSRHVNEAFLSEPLERPIAASARLTSYKCSFALTADDTASWGECLARWKATFIGGAVDEWEQQFKVVQSKVNYVLTPALLRQRYPDINSKRFRTNDLTELIATGWEMLRTAMDARGLSPERIRSWDALTWLHAKACYLHLALLQEPFDDIKYNEVKLDYREHLRATLEASKLFWYDADNTNTPRADDHLPALPGLRITR